MVFSLRRIKISWLVVMVTLKPRTTGRGGDATPFTRPKYELPPGAAVSKYVKHKNPLSLKGSVTQ